MGSRDDYRQWIAERFVEGGPDGLRGYAASFGDSLALLHGGHAKRIRDLTEDDPLLDRWLLDFRSELDAAVDALDRGDFGHFLALVNEGENGRS
jgi:hypothetical protein